MALGVLHPSSTFATDSNKFYNPLLILYSNETLLDTPFPGTMLPYRRDPCSPPKKSTRDIRSPDVSRA
jgi:hypothetical protein